MPCLEGGGAGVQAAGEGIGEWGFLLGVYVQVQGGRGREEGESGCAGRQWVEQVEGGWGGFLVSALVTGTSHTTT